jgi:hypothetical protein
MIQRSSQSPKEMLYACSTHITKLPTYFHDMAVVVVVVIIDLVQKANMQAVNELLL